MHLTKKTEILICLLGKRKINQNLNDMLKKILGGGSSTQKVDNFYESKESLIQKQI